MTPAGRRTRVAATCVVLALLLVGSAVGHDDHFPFGPFVMFAYRIDPHYGVAHAVYVVGRSDGGAETRLPMSSFGLRRAEVEGQVRRFIAEPARLAALADARAQVRPAAPRLVEIRLMETSYEIVDGRRVGESDRELARWAAR
ncbi:MAG: hypothetical protein ABR520_00585 [Mycobacteriales bacterium]